MPEGWSRDVWLVVRPYLLADEAVLVERNLAVTGVIELTWTEDIADALHGIRDDIVVEWVRPNRTRVPRPNAQRNVNAADTSNIDALLPGGSTGFALTGADVTLGEWDEGAPRVSHREFVGRVAVGDGAGPVDHSTQVAGTMIASGVTGAARGMATAAEIVSHDWDLDGLELHAAAPMVAATNHSYGAILGWDSNSACDDLPSWLGGDAREDPAFGKYMADAQAIDTVVRARDVLAVWAAGNERQDMGAAPGQPHYHWPSCSRTYSDTHVSENAVRFDTLGGQPTFKNGLIVGAVSDVLVDPQTTASIAVEPYSSRGPMDDSRIKPDLVANGQSVRTTGGAADDAYSVASGTSLATPVVTGALALLTQKYRQVNAGRDPRAAELKSLVVHTAVEVGANPGPDYEAGFGLLDAKAAAELLDAEATRPLASRQLRTGTLASGVVETYVTTDVVSAGTALRATLVWLDPAGAPNVGGIDDATPTLVNDLDVALVAPDQQTVFYPWRLQASTPAAAATRSGANRVDNVEQVDVDASQNVWTGRWSIRVNANSALSPRGHAQAYGLASSVAFSAPTSPVLGAPRTILVEAAFGSTPANITVPLINVGGGSLSWSLSETVTWINPSATTGNAPGGVELSFDVSEFTEPGDHVGVLEIDSSDASGPRAIGVRLRLTCAPDCANRACGIDPVCGQSCGRCVAPRACSAAGSCVALVANCPAANLGSQLGVVAQGSTVGRASSTSGSCGGGGGNEIVFEWVAPAAGRYAFTTLGSDYDTVMYLRDGACTGPELGCNDDSGGFSSTVSELLAAGQRVFVVLDGFSGAGDFVLTIDRAGCPTADLGSVLGAAVLNTNSVGAVNDLAATCGGASGEDIAVRWTAPADGEFRFSTQGSENGNDTVLYVLDGDCDGAELGCADVRNSSGGVHAADTLLLNLVRDQSVVVVIDARAAANVGDVQLGITATADSCAGACGGSPNGGCFCDSACLAAGDCCTDACSLCGHCVCTPSCVSAVCGDDGCGGSCGACVSGEICVSGACAIDPCAGVTCGACEACVGGSCAALPEFAACDDGVACSVADQCVAGVCAGSSLGCNDNNACTTDACDETNGRCAFTAMTGCCTQDGDCNDADVCTTDGCDVPNQRCTHQERAMCCRGPSECDDSDECTVDSCLLGGCFHAGTASCDEADAGDHDAGELSDGGAVSDAGWSNAAVRGGGCNCSVAVGRTTTSPAATVLWLVLLGVALRLGRRVVVTRGPRAVAAASRSHRLR